MATSMIKCLPDRAQNLILTGIMAGRSIFLLGDDSGVTRPTYKDLLQRACGCVFLKKNVQNSFAKGFGLLTPTGPQQELCVASTMG